MSRRLEKYWRGKRVFLTGASSGLGWAVAEALAPYGVFLGLVSRREEKLRELAQKVEAGGSRVWYAPCDVRNREQVYAAVGGFAEAAGGIDVVWANAGVGYESSMRRWDWDAVEAMIDTNLKGAIYTIRAAVERMAGQKRGTVVAVGSAASMRGLPTRGIYSLTKIALAYFMESMAAELPHLQFTTIHPGFVDTPINQGNPSRFWLMQPPEAAQLMLRAVAKRKIVYIYPWKMALLYRFVKSVPVSIYMPLVRRLSHLARPAPPPGGETKNANRENAG